MRVGIMIEGQEGLTWERWLRLAQAAEDMGYESLCRSDHLTGLAGEPAAPVARDVDLAHRARRRARGASASGPWSRPITFYHPALLAKMAVAMDTLSGGRFDLGIGAGWNEYEHAMFGVPMPPIRSGSTASSAAARYIRALGRGRAGDARAALLPAGTRRRAITRRRPTAGCGS